MMANKSNSSQLVALAAAVVLVAAAGAGSMYLYLRGRTAAVPAGPVSTTAPPAADKTSEAAVLLMPDAVARARIKTARPTVAAVDATTTGPGIVEPNAYNQVVVRSVASGQVRSVTVDLGASVKRGDLLATIHTPDLADTVRMYLSMRSEFEAAHQRLTRLEGLIKIGAASQQELETARAEHTRHATDVESAKAKLILLGIGEAQVASVTESAATNSLLRVTAPRDGLITARAINTGANIDASTDLFTVADLDSVWIVANVYERDLGRVPVGTPATVTAPGIAGKTWTGRVAYVDPQLATDTRTAKVRIAVPNPGRLLTFGLYMDVTFSTAVAAKGLLIPRTAVQTIGGQTVVYVGDALQAGRYVERSVALGPFAQAQVQILSGLTDVDDVVVEGSFALRAERDRLGLPPPVALQAIAVGEPPQQAAARVEIAITKDGFVPTTATVKAGGPIDLVFTRTTDDTCAKEVAVPSISARQALPLNKPVTIRLAAPKPGNLAFVCGMDMLRGTVVVK